MRRVAQDCGSESEQQPSTHPNSQYDANLQYENTCAQQLSDDLERGQYTLSLYFDKLEVLIAYHSPVSISELLSLSRVLEKLLWLYQTFGGYYLNILKDDVLKMSLEIRCLAGGALEKLPQLCRGASFMRK